MTYAEKLRSPLWQKKRLEILQRDGWHCQLCSDAESNLQVHHKSYASGKEPWEYHDENFITYCEHCHALTEFLKKETTYTPLANAKVLNHILNYYLVVVQDSIPPSSEEEIIVLAIHRHPLNKTFTILLSINRKNINALGAIMDSAINLSNGKN